MTTKNIILIVVATIILGAIIALGLYMRDQKNQIEDLQLEIAKQKIEYILRLDSVSFTLREQMLKSLAHQDSVSMAEFNKLNREQLKLNKQYEKINAEYSDIIISRPEF